MSLLSRAAETYLPLHVACGAIGYPTDSRGQRNLRRQMRRKGFEVRRVGNAFSIQVAVFQSYITHCERQAAAHRARISAANKARWAERKAALSA